MVIEVALAFAEGVATELGAKIVDELFGNDDQAKIEEMIEKEVRRVVRDEIRQNALREMSANCAAVADAVRAWNRLGTDDPTILYSLYFNQALPLNANLRSMGRLALPTFLIEVGLQASILQALMSLFAAKRQEMQEVGNANLLIFDLSAATAHAEAMEQAWRKHNDERFTAVIGSPPRVPIALRSGSGWGTGPDWNLTWQYFYTLDGVLQGPYPTRAEAERTRTKHIAQETADLEEHVLAPSAAVRAQWQKVVKRTTQRYRARWTRKEKLGEVAVFTHAKPVVVTKAPRVRGAPVDD